MRIIKIFLLFVAIFVGRQETYSQTFKIIDYKDYKASTEQLNKMRAKILGAKISIETFPNSIKLIVPDEPKDEIFILDKQDNGTYVIQEKGRKGVIVLNTIVNYIKGGTYKVFVNDKVVGEIIFERDGVF